MLSFKSQLPSCLYSSAFSNIIIFFLSTALCFYTYCRNSLVCQTALKLATWLSTHNLVANTYYPGFEDTISSRKITSSSKLNGEPEKELHGKAMYDLVLRKLPQSEKVRMLLITTKKRK